MFLLWMVIVALVLLWVLGMLASVGGYFVHLLLVVAVLVLVYDLLINRRRVP